MLGLGKKREFLLKLFCGVVFLFVLSFLSWSLTWFGLLFLISLSLFLHLNSTSWIIKKLDLGPEDAQFEDIHISPILKQLAKKYEMAEPTVYKLRTHAPLVMGFGSKEESAVIYSEPFLQKLSLQEKEALLEIAIHKIESQFCKNIEFVIHLNSLILAIGSKLDLAIAFIIGLKKNKNVASQHYILFSRMSLVGIRIINYFYMNKKVFAQFDEITYQNNPHLILALNKTLIYSPFEKKSINPLLCPFNFCNLPRYVAWHKNLELQSDIETRLSNFQISQNLMLESLTI